jgi:hypothetical protein
LCWDKEGAVGFFDKVPPLCVGLKLRLAGVEFLSPLGGNVVVGDDKEAFVAASHLGFRTGTAKGLEEKEERTCVLSDAKLFRLVWTERALATYYAKHVVPCGIGAFKAVFGVCHAAVVEVNFPDDTASVSWVVYRVLLFGAAVRCPLEQVFAGCLNLPTVPDEVDSEIAFV